MPSLLTVNLVFDCCRSSKKSKGEENHRTEEEREWKKPSRNALDKSDRNRLEGYEGVYACMTR